MTARLAELRAETEGMIARAVRCTSTRVRTRPPCLATLWFRPNLVEFGPSLAVSGPMLVEVCSFKAQSLPMTCQTLVGIRPVWVNFGRSWPSAGKLGRIRDKLGRNEAHVGRLRTTIYSCFWVLITSQQPTSNTMSCFLPGDFGLGEAARAHARATAQANAARAKRDACSLETPLAVAHAAWTRKTAQASAFLTLTKCPSTVVHDAARSHHGVCSASSSSPVGSSSSARINVRKTNID